MSERMNIKLYLAIGVGGMIGATARYGISLLFVPYTTFPYATLTVNLIGCFLLSFLFNQAAIKRKLSPQLFAAIGTGMIGAFTTFSTFAIEIENLWHVNGFIAIGYILISICGGLFCCFGGYKLASRNRNQVTS